MKTVDFTQHLLSIQTELFRFAFKLTADREEANDLLQETSLKALDNVRGVKRNAINRVVGKNSNSFDK